MNIIAITSCPVGMAHTYMAAKALEKVATKNGINIKVETQGSVGIKNRLTKEDIENADVFIDSADIAITDRERFEHVLTYKTSTTQVIKKTVQVLQEAINLVKNKKEK